MDSLGNANHAISVVGYWIFDSNYNKELVLNRESLEMICSPYVGEEQAAKFETVFATVTYIRSDAQLKKEWLWYISHNTIISMIFAKTIEGNYIDLLVYSYLKETNWCWTKKIKINLMIVNTKIYNKYI